MIHAHNFSFTFEILAQPSWCWDCRCAPPTLSLFSSAALIVSALVFAKNKTKQKASEVCVSSWDFLTFLQMKISNVVVCSQIVQAPSLVLGILKNIPPMWCVPGTYKWIPALTSDSPLKWSSE